MINNWWVTRPKRKLISVPEDLAIIASAAIDREWGGDRKLHLSIEQELEASGLKREGERRDQGGGGARTYVAWLKSLGLLFAQNTTGQLKLTLAGEELLKGKCPTYILTEQIFKYQFPSPFSIGASVNVSPRFKIRPFKFLFKLLLDDRVEYLTQDEIAKIVITEAENESEKCYEHVVRRLLEFREKGDACLPDDFETLYPSTRKDVKTTAAERLNSIANTIINWMEYTQFITRDDEHKVRVALDERSTVEAMVFAERPFISRADDEEVFQRKFGVDPWHSKDLRNLSKTQTITAAIIAKARVQKAFLSIASRKPILNITSEIISEIAEQTGIPSSEVEEMLGVLYPNGAVGCFMPSYNAMAFSGTEQATDFELATTALFKDVFGFETKHVGPIGKTPDVLLLSDQEGYQAIIDNKAYANYTITNDHMNRMVVNYIEQLGSYSSSSTPLAFFSYIAGGFGKNIDNSILQIKDKTLVPGCAMTVGNLIRMMELHMEAPYTHAQIRDIFSVNRRVTIDDVFSVER